MHVVMLTLLTAIAFGDEMQNKNLRLKQTNSVLLRTLKDLTAGSEAAVGTECAVPADFDCSVRCNNGVCCSNPAKPGHGQCLPTGSDCNNGVSFTNCRGTCAAGYCCANDKGSLCLECGTVENPCDPASSAVSSTYYTYTPKACVQAGNLILYNDKSVEECKDLCNANANCRAFEYGVNYNSDSPDAIQPRDCYLQKSTYRGFSKYPPCNGEWYNMDLYIKRVGFPPSTSETEDTALPVCDVPANFDCSVRCNNGVCCNNPGKPGHGQCLPTGSDCNNGVSFTNCRGTCAAGYCCANDKGSLCLECGSSENPCDPAYANSVVVITSDPGYCVVPANFGCSVRCKSGSGVCCNNPQKRGHGQCLPTASDCNDGVSSTDCSGKCAPGFCCGNDRGSLCLRCEKPRGSWDMSITEVVAWPEIESCTQQITAGRTDVCRKPLDGFCTEVVTQHHNDEDWEQYCDCVTWQAEKCFDEPQSGKYISGWPSKPTYKKQHGTLAEAKKECMDINDFMKDTCGGVTYSPNSAGSEKYTVRGLGPLKNSGNSEITWVRTRGFGGVSWAVPQGCTTGAMIMCSGAATGEKYHGSWNFLTGRCSEIYG